MKRSLALLAATLTVACSQPAPRSGQPALRAAAATSSDINTIDNADPRPAIRDPPPMLTDEGVPGQKLKTTVAAPDAPPPPNAQDEALRSSLPFAPAIALDPIDGSQISIRAATARAEVKGKVFYFSSEDNKRKFMQ